MTVGRDRLVEDRTAVRLGAVLGATAIALIVGSIAFGYLYLWAGAEAWPPPGFEPISLSGPFAVTALIVVATLAGWWATRGHGPVSHLGLTVSWVAGLIGLVVLTFAIIGADLRPTEHAYGSISMMLLGTQWIVLAVATTGSILVQLRALFGAPPEWLISGRLATTALWALAVLVTLVVVATAVAMPHLAGK